MTQTLGTNVANDIYLGANGNIVILSGILGVEGACQTAAYAQLGEMVLSVNRGIPNFQVVWVGSPNLAIFEAALRTTLENVDGVQTVKKLTLSVANNELSYEADIVTDFGPTTISGTIDNG